MTIFWQSITSSSGAAPMRPRDLIVMHGGGGGGGFGGHGGHGGRGGGWRGGGWGGDGNGGSGGGSGGGGSWAVRIVVSLVVAYIVLAGLGVIGH
jgi:hypothetical protein